MTGRIWVFAVPCHNTSPVPSRAPCTQGIKATTRRPNPDLYQSRAVLAAEMGVTEEARKWFQRGTDTVMVRPELPFGGCATGHAALTFMRFWGPCAAVGKMLLRQLAQHGSPGQRWRLRAGNGWEVPQRGHKVPL